MMTSLDSILLLQFHPFTRELQSGRRFLAKTFLFTLEIFVTTSFCPARLSSSSRRQVAFEACEKIY